MQNIISILNRYLSHINMPSVNIIDVIEILLISIFVYEFMRKTISECNGNNLSIRNENGIKNSFHIGPQNFSGNILRKVLEINIFFVL